MIRLDIPRFNISIKLKDKEFEKLPLIPVYNKEKTKIEYMAKQIDVDKNITMLVNEYSFIRVD